MFLGCISTGRVGLCFYWFFVQELLEAPPAMVLVLKRLRRRGKNFLWLSLGSNQYRREGLWFVCLLYDGSTRRLAESGFMVFFYGEAGNRTCDPWFIRHRAYPLHHGGFSKTFCRNQYRREGLWFVCLLYDGSTRRLTESGFMWFYGFMEKPGIEPATPGLQGIALIHYTTGLRGKWLEVSSDRLGPYI